MHKIVLFACVLISFQCIGQTLRSQLDKVINEDSSLRSSKAEKELQLIDLRGGTVLLSPQFSNKRTGTLDSDRGEISNRALLINYDNGLMSGIHMGEHKKEKCSYYVNSSVNGYRTAIGLQKEGEKSKLIITIYGKSKENTALPANFWAFVKNEEDIESVLKIVFSYMPKGR